MSISVWILDMRWDQEMTTLQWYTHTCIQRYMCSKSKQLVIGLTFGSSQILGPLLQDGNDVPRLKQGHALYMVAVFRDLIWDGIRIKYHSNSNGTNRHLTSMLCVLKAPGCGARF